MQNTTCNHTETRVTEDRPYSGSARGANPGFRAAHGGVSYYEICQCGHWREVNQNGRHVEHGAWLPPIRQFVGRPDSDCGWYLFFAPDGQLVDTHAVEHVDGAWKRAPFVRALIAGQCPTEAVEMARQSVSH